MLDCQRIEEVRFVATRLRLIVKDVKKHDLLPSVCAWLSLLGKSTICCHPFVLDCQISEEARFVAIRLCSIVIDGKKYDCCRQFVFDHQRWESMVVATSLCLIVKDGEKYDLLPPVCA